MNLRTRMVSLFSFLLLSVPSFSYADDTSWFGGESELIYYFSFDCGLCYQNEPYYSLIKIKADPATTLIKVPVQATQRERAGARLQFLMALSKKHYKLSELERSRAGYSLLESHPELNPNDKEGYKRLFEDYGMQFSDFEFEKWWVDSSQLMADAEHLVALAERGEGQVLPGDVRVYKGGKTRWFSLYNEEPLPVVKAILKVINHVEI
ncbi:hypothetical protein [Alteromonas sp. 14N.309.X.WAT.G.H12]|uniref:hypothetical protein n=1 Tax=Alteromonas sp. 14N.309.X.WAT.G.H12 TaxID=3120824 RepID=UPI002FD689EE